jgi:hypothetical protein
MLRLDMPTEPAWHDMPHGVRLLLRPATAALVAAADVRARSFLGENPTPDDTALAQGVAFQMRAQKLGQYLIEAWEGVADAEGNPAPVTPANIDTLMRVSADLTAAFLGAVHAPLDRMTAEGNA